MTKEDKICAFCKYHFIEEISFDSPQSCCKKRKATTEKWLKCDDFEYSDRYIEALQQKVNQLEKENKELSRMCELYSKSLYNAELKRYKQALLDIKEYLQNWSDNWYANSIQNDRENVIYLLDILDKALEVEDE